MGKIKCPVCGKEYDTPSQVAECLLNDEALKKANEDYEKEKKIYEQMIEEDFEELNTIINEYNERYGAEGKEYSIYFKPYNKKNNSTSTHNSKSNTKSLEEVLKDSLNIGEPISKSIPKYRSPEQVKKVAEKSKKKLSIPELYQLSEKEGFDAVESYIDNLSEEEADNLLEEGAETLIRLMLGDDEYLQKFVGKEN